MRGAQSTTSLRRLGRGVLWGAFACALTGLAATPGHCLGTPAGTVISNSASVAYVLNGGSYTQKSNTNTLMVDDKVSFTLTAGDTGNVTVTPGGRAYQTYLLTNTGNGPHDFTLSSAVTGSATLTPSAGPTFYADQAGTTALPVDANAGSLPYLVSLAPDAARTVYLYLSAPVATADAQWIGYQVTAEAYQPGNLGAVNPPVKSSAKAATDAASDKNSHLMKQYVLLADGHGNGGDADRDGRYSLIAKDANGSTVGFKALAATVNVAKSALVIDPAGGSQPVSGTTIRYTLSVSTAGAGSALGVVISDAIPDHTTYTAGTLKLNGHGLTDAADGDAGEVTGTPGTVTVRLGDLTAASAAQTIVFDVKIQ